MAEDKQMMLPGIATPQRLFPRASSLPLYKNEDFRRDVRNANRRARYHNRSKAVDVLKQAIVWWEVEAQYLTTGEYGEYNVFDDTPRWVLEARKLLAQMKGGV